MNNLDSGFVKLYRSFFDHFLWNEDREYSKAEAWIDLIRTARYKEGTSNKMVNGQVVEWGRGDLLASVRFLKNRWNWNSTGKVTRFLDLLEKQNMVSRKTEQGVTVLSICNYCTYNPLEDDDRTETEREQNNDRTETEREQVQNSKKDNKGKESKELYTIGNSEKLNQNQQISHTSFVDKFNELYDRQLRVTDKKREMIRARLRTFTGEEILRAWKNRLKDDYLNGDGSKYLAKWGAAMRNDEKIERYLHKQNGQTGLGDNSKYRRI